MLLYIDDCFTQHETGYHPENKKRIQVVNRALREADWFEESVRPQWEPAGMDELCAVHKRSYVEQLKTWCDEDAGNIEADTVVGPGSWQAATMAAGAAVDAVQKIVEGDNTKAFCAIRPPGHHALPNGAMGFCVLNNIAIAALYAISRGLHRVLIVDWDVHHGNGTQDAFYEDGRVGFFSIHRSPFYPGTGALEETGSGQGLGWISNAPVPAGIRKQDYFDRFDQQLERLAERVNPELILISAGFDAHPQDPVGGLCLEEEDFAELTRKVKALANSYCGGKIVSMLEGGYHLEHLPRCVLAHTTELHKP